MSFRMSIKTVEGSGRTAWLGGQIITRKYGNTVIDAAKYAYEDSDRRIYLPSGTVLGRITATGKYRRCTQTLVNHTGGYGSSDAALVVDDAKPFVAADVISILDSTGTWRSKTISAVNYTTNTITLTGTLGATINDDAPLQGSDGSEVAVTLLEDDVDLTDRADVAAVSLSRADVFIQRLPYTLTEQEQTDLSAQGFQFYSLT